MKSLKIYLLSFLVLPFGTNILNAQWKPAPVYNTGANDLYFNTQNWGYLVGDNGYLAKTSDVGLTWQTQVTPSKSSFQCVDFPSALTGYVGTYNGEVLKTINGGTNWIILPPTGATDIKNIDFLSDEIGWFCTYTGAVYRTNNGGVSWESKQLSGINYLEDIHFYDTKKGWVVGSNGTSSVAYKTSNGGVSWELITSINLGGSAKNVQFYDENNGWISTYQGTIYRTNDGGQTWSTSTIPVGLFINDMQFINSTIGFVATSGGLFKSSDSGQTWSLTNFGTNGVASVFFIDEMNGHICRGTGMNYYTSDGGNTWTNVSNDQDFALSFYGLTFVDALTGWSVGEIGTIRRTNDGGNSWQIQSNPITTALFAIDFNTSTNGWVVGANGKIAATVTGGATWSSQTSGTTEALFDVDFVSVTTGIVVGANGKIIRTTNGGSTWSNIPSGSVNNLRSVHFATASEGYIVGFANTILKTTNGGTTWTSISNPAFATTNFLGVYFIDASTGIAVGSNGMIIKTTNGGTTWTQIPTGITDPLLSVDFIDAQEGWAVGYNGAVLHTYDAGNTWYNENLAEFTNQPYNSVATIPGGGAFIVGNLSLEFQYEDNCNPIAPTDYSTSAELAYCAGTNTSSILMAGGKGKISWYDAPTGGTYLGSGNTYTTPSNLTTATSYYVQDSTCTASSSRTLIELSVSATIPTATITQNITEFTTVETGVSYQWIECDSNVFIAGETNQNFTAIYDGNYAVIVNLNGCETQSNCIDVFMGTAEIEKEKMIDFYPNPSTTELTIKLHEGQKGLIRILSTEGVLVYEEKMESPLFTIDVSALTNGMYYISLELENEILSRSFIKSDY